MNFRHVVLMFAVAAAGCSTAADSQRFSVFFQPYSASLDDQAKATVSAAARFALDNPKAPVSLIGFSAPPDPKLDVEGLSGQRAEVIKKAMVADGVAQDRISTSAAGITDPNGLPNLSVRRVDISFSK